MEPKYLRQAVAAQRAARIEATINLLREDTPVGPPPLPDFDAEREQRMKQPQRAGLKFERVGGDPEVVRITALADGLPFGREPVVTGPADDMPSFGMTWLSEWVAAHQHCGTEAGIDPTDNIVIE